MLRRKLSQRLGTTHEARALRLLTIQNVPRIAGIPISTGVTQKRLNGQLPSAPVAYTL